MERWKKKHTECAYGLPCNEVHGIISDDAGTLWHYAQRGLIKIGKDQMQLWWEHPDGKLKLRVFDAFDGVQPGFAYFDNSTKTPDGRLRFANGIVVQVIDPAHMPENTVPPPVDISGLVADHKAYEPGSAIRLPGLTRDLEIDYRALSYVAPQKILFITYWKVTMPAGRTRERGAKHFITICPDSIASAWSLATTMGSGMTPAPPWTSASCLHGFGPKWFFILSVLSGLMLVWAFFSMRTRQIQTSLNARFNEQLAERTRMARELHDTFLQTLQGSKLGADDALEKSSDPIHMRRAMEQLSD